MRNSHGEGRAQVVPRQDTVDVIGSSTRTWVSSLLWDLSNSSLHSTVAAQCYNCHTTATPLWRKDDEGKTVCNAYGHLYYYYWLYFIFYLDVGHTTNYTVLPDLSR